MFKRKHFDFVGVTSEESDLVKSLKAEIKDDPAIEDKTSIRYGIASTAGLDRDDEVLLPQGADVRHFMTNPVMLQIHAYGQPTVAKVHRLKVDDAQIAMAYEFAQTDAGKEYQTLYDTGFQRAFSVGFIPREYVMINEKTPDKLEVELPTFDEAIADQDAEEGKAATAEPIKVSLDLSTYPRRPRAVYTHWELLEVSPVPVPSNPEALAMRGVAEVMRKCVDQDQRAFVRSALLEEFRDLQGPIDDWLQEIQEREFRGAVASHSTPLDLEAAWDASAARAALARWASSDGSGSKETIEWGKFARGFAHFDSDNVTNFTAYKLPHHTVRDGQLVAIWRGVTAAMAALLGARGGVDVGGQEQAVWNHLARHYRDAERDPPALNRDYSEAELKAIEEGMWPVEKELPPEEPVAPPSDETATEPTLADVVAAVDRGFETLTNALLEQEDALHIRISVLADSIEEQLARFEPPEKTAKTRPDDGDDTSNEDTPVPGVDAQLSDAKAILDKFLQGTTTV